MAVTLAGGVLASPAGAATVVTPVATGLDVPAAFTFLPDGRILYGERFTGEIRLRDPARGTDDLVFTIPDVAGTGEQGLLGLALDPSYPTAPHVLAYVTRNFGGGTVNQILRIRMTQRHIGYRWGVIYHAPATPVHNGGRIKFGPDGNLYVVTADLQSPANSQNLSNTFGKVLRMTPTGGVPADNPFGNLVWAYGIHNSFGLTFDPATPSSGRPRTGPRATTSSTASPGAGTTAGGRARPARPPLAAAQHQPGRTQPGAALGLLHAPHRPHGRGVLCQLRRARPRGPDGLRHVEHPPAAGRHPHRGPHGPGERGAGLRTPGGDPLRRTGP